ncbi:response regulator receiver modulated diguanylate cyclase/phosphodiesterase [Caballeronia hypogeia]|uniref:Response regulator receiver modulated diguanylate cyclase/phosphodiesterase n=1 Tax=Caballeronia hypogeia TaxID=1777140 RepID=A0A158CSQ4_9BURK|nr:EAL domain-containing protein [Caballeronia hypogeia]SAK84617.1 response regulator receiver modulated diguanylate cyclase/phosphodiesterase [Caballeronia hypogeia]
MSLSLNSESCSTVASGDASRQGPTTAQNQEFLAFFLSARSDRATLSWPILLQIGLAVWGACVLTYVALGVMLSVVPRGVAPGISVAVGVAVFAICLRRARRDVTRANRTTALSRALLDANRECLKWLDADGRMVRISEYGARLMEASGPEQLAGSNWLGFWSNEDAIAAHNAFHGAMNGARTAFKGSCATTSGIPKVWHSRLIPIEDGKGGVDGIICASMDMTQEEELAAALRARETLMSEMEAHVGLCFYSYSADFTGFHHISAGCASVFGLDAQTFRESPQAWMDLVLPEDLPQLKSAMGRISESKISQKALYRIRRSNGDVRWIQSTGSPVLDSAGNVARIVGISEDITAEQDRLVELDRLAFTDSLTGLANRAALMRRIDEDCRKKAPFALMFVDLDRFKVLNDTLGHTAADRLLRSLSRIISAALPPGAFLARLGGDEFAVLIEGERDKERLADIARGALGALVQADQARRAGTITASIGISVFPDNGANRETLLTSADIAMYAAKKAGRNGYRFADKDSSERIVDFELERDLPAALARKQFQLHYQAIHEPRTLEVRSVEALIRWRHPKRGLVSPGVFIPILEESGFITEVGAWVMDDALRQLSQWRRGGARSLGVSVNVSARQLRDAAIVDVVDSALRRHALPPSTLQLELTESALMDDPSLAQSTLGALKKLGVRIAIDDFGTGYSSLRYLADFAPDCVKIDRSFIARLEQDKATRSIVSGIIQMSHTLGMSVIAEGVEETAQLESLRRAECDFVQGFLLSRPVAPEDMSGLSIAAQAVDDRLRSPASA